MQHSLRDFCHEYFEVMGCLVEPCNDSTYDVLLHDELAPFFKQNTYLKVGFTPDVNGKVDLLTHGSPVLSGILESSVQMGRTTRRFATGISLKKGDISSRILKEYHLQSNKIKFFSPFSAFGGYLLLYYKVSYLADEKRDYIYPVAVDLSSGAINEDIFNIQDYLFLKEEPEVDLAYQIQISASTAHQIASRHLGMKAKETYDVLNERTKKKRMREIERVNKFFKQCSHELKLRLEGLDLDNHRRPVILQKIEAIKIEQERKIIDLDKKYTYRIKGELVAACLLIQPRIYYQFELFLPYVATQGYFSWDPILKRIDPPVCHVCHKPLQGISVCTTGHMVCRSCGIYCCRCKRLWCRLCGPEICPHNLAVSESTPGEVPQIEFSPTTFEVLGRVEKNVFNSPSRFMLCLKAHEISLIEGFDKLLCLDIVHHIEQFGYQIETVRKVLRDFSGRALLADEVGLGKTIEAGLVLKEYVLRGLARRVLILVPPSLVDQWHGELLDKFELDFSTAEDYDFSRDSQYFWENKPWIIASLHTAKREPHAGIILKQHFDLVIIDEAHHLKNRQTQVWKFVNSLDKRFILLLTATPVQNNLEELFNLITLLKPGQLSTYRQFKKEFGVRGDKLAVKNSDKLRQHLSEVMIRNSRSEISIKLPPRRAEIQRIELYPEELALYQEVTAFVRRFQPVVRSSERGFTPFTLQLLQMEAGSSPFSLMQTIEKMLHNPANYPDAISKLKELQHMTSQVKKTAKVQALLDWISSRAEATLIFTHFLRTQKFISEILRENGFKVWDYHGGLSNTQKEEVIAKFRDEGGILVSTEVGGEGKNFQFCQNLINFDLPWNPMKIEQRIGRIHRIGQEKPVNIINFSARGTIESYILRILDEKINMFELVIGEMDMILGNLDEEREFENIVMEIWARANDDRDAEQEFEHLGEKLLEAKRRYIKQKKLDEDLFNTDFSS